MCRSAGKPDINKVLETKLQDWSAPQLVEVEYAPELRRLYQDSAAETEPPSEQLHEQKETGPTYSQDRNRPRSKGRPEGPWRSQVR
jgi:hypothetical protein